MIVGFENQLTEVVMGQGVGMIQVLAALDEHQAQALHEVVLEELVLAVVDLFRFRLADEAVQQLQTLVEGFCGEYFIVGVGHERSKVVHSLLPDTQVLLLKAVHGLEDEEGEELLSKDPSHRA